MASEYLMTQIYLLNYILLGLGFFKLFTPKFILYYLAIIFKTPCREKNLELLGFFLLARNRKGKYRNNQTIPNHMLFEKILNSFMTEAVII